MVALTCHLEEFFTHLINNQIKLGLNSFIFVVAGSNRSKTTKQYHFILLGICNQESVFFLPKNQIGAI